MYHAWPMEGGRLARYRIIGRLGAGGMGEGYRARDEQLDRDVAVKVLPSSAFDDPTARARLLREAKAAAALNHPNVCTVLVDHGATVDATTALGWTPLKVAEGVFFANAKKEFPAAEAIPATRL